MFYKYFYAATVIISTGIFLSAAFSYIRAQILKRRNVLRAFDLLQ